MGSYSEEGGYCAFDLHIPALRSLPALPSKIFNPKGRQGLRKGREAPDLSNELRLTLIYLPIPFALVAELQQAVFRVVPLAALGTLQIPAPSCSLAIVVFGNGKGSPATAGDEKHLERLVELGHPASFPCE